jgi:hypothetical protein
MDSACDTAEAVGFPIRKSTDQSLFATPRSLSQRTTSFIASQRQGIHRTPLRHLIALIIDARRAWRRRSILRTRPACIFLETDPIGRRSGAASSCDTPARRRSDRSSLHDVKMRADCSSSELRDMCLPRDCVLSIAGAVWWSQTGSNRRPPACKAGALPTELWPRRRTELARARTPDGNGGPG